MTKLRVFDMILCDEWRVDRQSIEQGPMTFPTSYRNKQDLEFGHEIYRIALVLCL